MSSPFAGKQSGIASMLTNMLPPDVVEAIKVAKEQLPAVIDNVQRSVQRIENKLDMIMLRVDQIRVGVSANNPAYVPDELPVLLPSGELLINGNIVQPVTDSKTSKGD